MMLYKGKSQTDVMCHQTSKQFKMSDTPSSGGYAINVVRQCLEVIKLEYSLKLKIKCNDWLLVDTCPQAANHCALLEFENELKFYNLLAMF